jgi:hypothetical protein
MANNRKAIREAISDLLIAADTAAASNVFSNRKQKLSLSELPAIIIYSEEEPIDPKSQRATQYTRTYQVRIDLKIQASDNVDDDLDDFCAEVETAMIANSSLTGTVLGHIQTNTQLSVEEDGEQDIGVASLSFECKYIS